VAREPVRLREVADIAGVTVSTASRALNRPELVRPETRERVTQAARLLGYVPNRMARAVVTGHSETIVFILPDLSLGLFHTVASAAQREARARKFELFVADSMGNANREADLIEAARGYAEGVILLWPQGEYTPERADPPVVAIGRRMQGAHSVILDQSNVVEVQLAHLRGLGHEQILWVDGQERYGAARERRRHARRMAAEYPFALSAPVEPSFEGGIEIADALDPSITAVMAFVDNQALGIIARLAERGIRVPDDVSVIGNNDVMWARMANPALTTLRTPFVEMGSAAVSLLLDNLPATEAPQIVETMRSELVVRRSTAPPRRS
jgi:DNA-binding LacI/PurR family transcriptional regulator